MIHAIINHRVEVQELSQEIKCPYRKNSNTLAIDFTPYGICEYNSDPEHGEMHRDTLFELSNDTMPTEEEQDHTHYPNAPEGSIWDY